MKTVVISQPMVFPWVGLFEQIALADVYVHYDDVQLPGGASFSTRVQVKTAGGIKWLTVPVKREGLQLIRDVQIDHSRDWKNKHLMMLRQEFARTKHKDLVFDLISELYAAPSDSLAQFNANGIERIARFLALRAEFLWSSQLDTPGQSTDKVLATLQLLGANRYVTGHGAIHYMDHPLMERAGIAIEYMQYKCRPYPQLHGEFTPYVSILDLIANCGDASREMLISGTIGWKEFAEYERNRAVQRRAG